MNPNKGFISGFQFTAVQTDGFQVLFPYVSAPLGLIGNSFSGNMCNMGGMMGR